jgi:hypothetical protein
MYLRVRVIKNESEHAEGPRSYPDLRYYPGICQKVGVEIKVSLSLSLIKLHITKTHGVKAPDRDVWSASQPGRFIPGNCWMGERLGHTTGLDDLKNIISAPIGNRDVVQHVSGCQITTWSEVVFMYAGRKWQKTRKLPQRTADHWAEVKWYSL